MPKKTITREQVIECLNALGDPVDWTGLMTETIMPKLIQPLMTAKRLNFALTFWRVHNPNITLIEYMKLYPLKELKLKYVRGGISGVSVVIEDK